MTNNPNTVQLSAHEKFTIGTIAGLAIKGNHVAANHLSKDMCMPEDFVKPLHSNKEVSEQIQKAAHKQFIEKCIERQSLKKSKNKLEKVKSIAADFAAVLLLAALSIGFASMAYDQSEKAKQHAEVSK